MNKVILIGRLARDPELRTTPTNLSVATFTIAISRPFNSQNGGAPETELCGLEKTGREFSKILS